MAEIIHHRLKLFYLLDYLMENTDEHHSVSASDIIDHLQKAFEISATRKTLYSDLTVLKDHGIEINDFDQKEPGWKILGRDFQLYELQLLIDAVQSSKFITEKKARDISNKLKKFCSKHERPHLERRSYVPNRIRSENDSVFYGIDNIHACIDNDRKISFKYFTYTANKKKRYLKKGEPYIASPYALMWGDNNYYLVAFEQGKIKHFRVDKMDNILPLDDEREGKAEFKAMKLSERSTKVFSMYGGREEAVKLKFSNHLTGVAIDRFGKNVMMIPEGDKHFIVNVDVEVSPQFFGWLCGLGRAVKVIFPESVAKEMSNFVSGIAEMYRTDANIQESEPEA